MSTCSHCFHNPQADHELRGKLTAQEWENNRLQRMNATYDQEVTRLKRELDHMIEVLAERERENTELRVQLGAFIDSAKGTA